MTNTELQDRMQEAKQRLQEQLTQPIVIMCGRFKDGSKAVYIRAPWNPKDGYDVSLDDDPRMQVNTAGDIRMSCTGFEDTYCNVGAKEARLFAWEVALGAEIADRWEEFWAAPTEFVRNHPNPSNYQWLLI